MSIKFLPRTKAHKPGKKPLTRQHFMGDNGFGWLLAPQAEQKEGET